MLEEGTIPDKLYFRIGEVARMIGVEPYVLRYWETEFPEISPVKSKAKQRLYKKQDVELIYKIRELLHHQNYTIKGAKRKIKDLRRSKDDSSAHHSSQQIDLGFESTTLGSPLTAESHQLLQTIIEEMDQFLE